MSTQSALLALQNLIKKSAESPLVIQRPYLKLCGGDHLAALLLTQIIYWSERTSDPDGWIAKAYEPSESTDAPEGRQDWYTELGLTKRQVQRIISVLEPLGIETRVFRDPIYRYAPVQHYRVNWTVLMEHVVRTFNSDEMSLSDSDVSSLSRVTKRHEQIQRLPAELTAETTHHPALALENDDDYSSKEIEVFELCRHIFTEGKPLSESQHNAVRNALRVENLPPPLLCEKLRAAAARPGTRDIWAYALASVRNALRESSASAPASHSADTYDHGFAELELDDEDEDAPADFYLAAAPAPAERPYYEPVDDDYEDDFDDSPLPPVHIARQPVAAY